MRACQRAWGFGTDRSVKQLYKLINGVVQSLASVGWVILLTFLLLYSAALVCPGTDIGSTGLLPSFFSRVTHRDALLLRFTSLVGQGYIYNDPDEMPEEAVQYFGTVWRSFLALFKLMNDDQSVVAPIITTITGQILFYAFMMLSNWMMLAILTSVVSDNMMSASRVKEEEDRKKAVEEDQQRAKRRIQQIFRELDEDQNGSISEHEMVTLLSDPNLQAELCEASRLHPADLVEMLYCSSQEPSQARGCQARAIAFRRLGYRTPSNERVILYHQFLTMLQDSVAVCVPFWKLREAMPGRIRTSEGAIDLQGHGKHEGRGPGPRGLASRSAFHGGPLEAMEFRLEKRLNAALQYLNVPPEEAWRKSPACHHTAASAREQRLRWMDCPR